MIMSYAADQKVALSTLQIQQYFEFEMTTKQLDTELSIDEINDLIYEQNFQLNKVIQYQKQIDEMLDWDIRKAQTQLIEEMRELQEILDKDERTQQNLKEMQEKIRCLQIQDFQLQEQLNQQRDKRKGAIQASKVQLGLLEEQYQVRSKELHFLENQEEQIKFKTAEMQEKLDQISKKNQQIQKQIKRINQGTQKKAQWIQQSFHMKKRLNNELQQLRGNIRVYCRIRPFHANQQKQPIYQLLNENTLKLNVPKQNQKSQSHQKQYTFNFQQIFDMKDTQQTVFNQLQQLIQSAVDGKNVCIFAYGQTGSGKTYTMQGSYNGTDRGIIPRSIDAIFEQVEKAKEYQWDAEIQMTVQEVYLETVKDLFNPENTAIQQKLTSFTVREPSQIQSLLNMASKNRKVAETSCNEHSSRSHLIFRIKITTKNGNKQRIGTLNLIDLAGSERVSLSKVQGERMKQTQAINKSLTHLGVVITALGKKQAHIPFRNSKLTFLLQPYLQGDSKTLMFVNISPKMSDFSQTICSLRFAEKVKDCKINTNNKK